MENKTRTQEEQVITAMCNEGGFATFKRLNEILDFSSWKSKTPEASVRRIVQNSKDIFRVKPGLWALESMRQEVLRRFDYNPDSITSEERFTHAYYQGLLLEIGNFRHKTTYVPAQDKNRKFIGNRLGNVAQIVDLPSFTYEKLLRKARTVDVIWFNERNMPSEFYEVEHTTDIKNSLSKFYELQDFFARFWIVADARRKPEFLDKLNVSMFSSIHKRVEFLAYDRVVKFHENLLRTSEVMW